MIPHKTDPSVKKNTRTIPIIIGGASAMLMLLCLFAGSHDRSAHSVFLFQSILLFFITACTCLVNPVGKISRSLLFAAIWAPFVLISLFYGMRFMANALHCVMYCGSFYLLMSVLCSFIKQRIAERISVVVPFVVILFVVLLPITGNYILTIPDDFLTRARTAELLVWANPFAVVSGIWDVDLMRWGWVYEQSVIGSSYPYRIPDFLAPSAAMLAASVLIRFVDYLIALFDEPAKAQNDSS